MVAARPRRSPHRCRAEKFFARNFSSGWVGGRPIPCKKKKAKALAKACKKTLKSKKCKKAIKKAPECLYEYLA